MRHNQAIEATRSTRSRDNSGPLTGLLAHTAPVFSHLAPYAIEWLLRDVAFYTYQSEAFLALPADDRKRLHNALTVFGDNMRELGRAFEQEHPELVADYTENY